VPGQEGNLRNPCNCAGRGKKGVTGAGHFLPYFHGKKRIFSRIGERKKVVTKGKTAVQQGGTEKQKIHSFTPGKGWDQEVRGDCTLLSNFAVNEGEKNKENRCVGKKSQEGRMHSLSKKKKKRLTSQRVQKAKR